MPRVTLSYRRDDSSAAARAIYDRLRARYGGKSVFMDIDAIEFGEDYRERIHHALSQTDVMLVLIGPRWLGPLPDGRTRIGNPNDPVRVEVERAFEIGLRVIPLLLEHTEMPSAAELPDSLGRLPFLNAADISTGREFDSQIDRIIRAIDRVAAPDRASSGSSGSRIGARQRPVLLAIVGAFIAVAIAIGAVVALVHPRSAATVAVNRATPRPAATPHRTAPRPVARPSHSAMPPTPRAPTPAPAPSPTPRVVTVAAPARTAQPRPKPIPTRQRVALQAATPQAMPARETPALPAYPTTWSGFYGYPASARQPAVSFSLTLRVDDGAVSGRTAEVAPLGNGSSGQLFATIRGAISGDRIEFTKTYDATAGANYATAVQYRGVIAADRRSITGTWEVGSTIGSFSISATP